MPETRGRTLEAMDHVFKDIISENEEARRKAIESELIRSTNHVDETQARKPLE